MAHILISLIGDQTAPNAILIQDKAFAHIDQYIFITTPQMEQKQRLLHLAKALHLRSDQYQKLVVQADDLRDIREKLENIQLNTEQDHFYINLTGGTKMMSIGLFAFFREAEATAKIYYIPVGQQVFWQIYPTSEATIMPLTATIGLATYLTSYGVARKEDKPMQHLSFPIAYTQKIFELFLEKSALYTEKQASFGAFMHKLRSQYNQARGKAINCSNIDQLDAFLEEIGFECSEKGRLNPAEVLYLIGGWFEAWVFYQIKKRLRLEDTAIWRNVKVHGMGDLQELMDQEFDILFMFQNTLYVVECKLGLGRGRAEVKKRFVEELFRLRSLNRALGIHVPTSLLSLSDELSNKSGKKKAYFEEKAKTLRITILDQYDLRPTSDDWVGRLVC